MEIHGHQTLAQIRADFRSVYKGLDIRFYKHHHEDHAGSKGGDEYDMHLTVSALNDEITSCVLDLDSEKTVAEMEAEFEAKVGIPIQVFRRSKDLWLQTISTDHWTLGLQNRKGINSTLS